MTRRSLFKTVAGAFAGCVLAKTAFVQAEVEPHFRGVFRNYTTQCRHISKAEFIERMRAAMKKLEFQPPLPEEPAEFEFIEVDDDRWLKAVEITELLGVGQYSLGLHGQAFGALRTYA